MKKVYNFFRYYKKKISLNLNFFVSTKLGSRIKHYKVFDFDGGWLIGKIKNSFLSIHLRPKKSKDIKIQIGNNFKYKVGIILQGPISVNEDNGEFLEETIKIYKKLFPYCKIVLSTWKLDHITFKKFEKLNISILENIEPKAQNFGKVRNIDRQILTTYTALEFLKNEGIEFALKSRTDWRIYKPNSIKFLINMILNFPTKSKQMKGRIVVTSMITSKFRIYGLTDTLQFGYTDDLINYWDKEFFTESTERLNLNPYPKIINFTPVISEIFLCVRFLNKINHSLLWSLRDWWKSLSLYFCVVDADSLDLLWTKYEDWFYEKRYFRSYLNSSPRAVEFSDWINILNDTKELDEWEKMGLQEKWQIKNGKLNQVEFY